MKRRDFLRRLGAAGGALSLAGTAAAWGRDAGQRKPNVLFISIDDLNDWVGCLGGHPQAKTPNIDRLARQGTLFTNACCPAPSCLPSRAALMTGRAPHKTGVYENNQVWREALPDAVTLPRHFMAHGYYCAGAGKIFHHFQNDPPSWHEYWPKKTHQFPPYKSPKKEDRSQFPRWKNIYDSFDWGPLDIPDEETGDYQSVKYCIGQLEKQHDRPFFLTCGIYRPHVPWFAPRKYFDMFPLDEIKLPPMYDRDLDDLPPYAKRRAENNIYANKMREYGLQPDTVRAYLACIAYTDALVGRLLDALDASPHAANTIVAFWSDHGWHLGEKNFYRKFTLWEESARVPLIFRLPKSMRANTPGIACRRPASLLDLYPTLSELCGLPVGQHLDGHSLAPLLRDPAAPWPHVAITSLDPGSHTVRTERWRYTIYKDDGEELYDHDADPNEWYNLAGKPAHAKVQTRLKALIPKDAAPMKKTESAAVRYQRLRREGAFD